MAGTKTSPQFQQQYGIGMLASLFFPQYAQAYASLKPQEFEQLFGQPGSKLKKTKGKVSNMGPWASAAGGSPTGVAVGVDSQGNPIDKDGNIVTQTAGGFNDVTNPYHRYVNQYNPFAYAASNPFGRPGGPSQQEADLLNNSLFGLASMPDFTKTSALTDQLTGMRQQNDIGNLGNTYWQVMNALGNTQPTPVMPQAPNIGGMGSSFSMQGNPNAMASLIGLLGG